MKSPIGRWNRQARAEERTPLAVEAPERRGYRHRALRLGSLGVYDSKDLGPHIHLGAVEWEADLALARLRVVTEEDAAAIKRAQEAIRAVQAAAQKVYAAAYRRGRQPTLDEVRAASEQVEREVGE